MPHIVDLDGSSRNLCRSKPKSRSHLALFETVDNCTYQHRQTEHHNAFGYLSQPFIGSSSSCNLLVRGSPESLFWRLPESRPLQSKADRNESSAIFAVMGVPSAPSRCYGSEATSRLALEDRAHFSPLQRRTVCSHKLDSSFSPLSTSPPTNGFSLLQPQTSTPIGFLCNSPFPLASMTDHGNVSTSQACHPCDTVPL